MKVYAVITEELGIHLTGKYVAGFAGSYEEPPEGDMIEDDDIESLIISRVTTVGGVKAIHEFDILAGLDRAAKAAVIQNVLEALGNDAVQTALLEAAE